MIGHQLVDQPGQAVGVALGGAALEYDVAVHRIAALGEVADHAGTQDPVVGRAYRDQPDAGHFARLGECADLQQCDRSGGEYRGSEDHQVFLAAWWWLYRRSRSYLSSLRRQLDAIRRGSEPGAGLTTADGRAVFAPPPTGFTLMHAYRTHTCGALRLTDAGQPARLSGWVHRKRDHGQLLFIDLRDHYGVTQCVIDISSPLFAAADALRLESVVTMTGRIAARSADTVNPKLDTGEVELVIAEIEILSQAEPLPFPVNAEAEYPEDMRLTYRFLDLRRERMHANILLRSNVIASIRRRMITQGFVEFQTPILTASSPEGARDYLVPSRLHPGKFYALPQAPQQFKQLLMVAGFDRYFQIAPCFRDEAGRADRSPGEFYQLDFEMSYVTQEDVFAAIEPVLHGVFEEFAGGRRVSSAPFPASPMPTRSSTTPATSPICAIRS